MKRLIALVLLVSTVSLACIGCGERTYTRQAFMLDTLVRITLYGGSEETADACMTLIAEAERALSRTDPESELAQLNAGEIDTVSAETAALIASALDMAKLTRGAFDPTVGRLSDLWNFSAVDPILPEPSAIAEALETVGYEGVRLTGNRIHFDHPGTVLDLGGIAKGEIADRLAAFLQAQGVERAILNLGGNVLVMGGTADDPYRVGVQDPESPTGESLLVLEITRGTVVTSGIYNRGFTAGGKYYHHILDAETGYPAENSLASVTVIGESSRLADALSTACMCLGEEAGMALIESLDGVDAVMITRDGRVLFSSGTEEKYNVTYVGEEGSR